MSIVLQTLGERVKLYRLKYKWSFKDLGDHSTVDPTYILRIERGDIVPSILMIRKIAWAFRVAAKDLIHYNPANFPDFKAYFLHQHPAPKYTDNRHI